MRTVLLLLSLAVLTGCSLIPVGNAEDRECVSSWPTAPIPEPNLLSPTIEERVAGPVGVAIVRLESASYGLPDRAENNRVNLGTVTLNFAVLERLKTEYHARETVKGHMDVGYVCEYVENDKRDREALAELSADLEEFFGDRELVMFLPPYSSFEMTSAEVSYHDLPRDTLERRYGLGRGWNDGSRWLLRAEGIGSDQDPHYDDPLDISNVVYVPESIIALSDLRERVNAVIAEEEERGTECVGAHYLYQWYVRSNEENWYRGQLGADGTPVECISN